MIGSPVEQHPPKSKHAQSPPFESYKHNDVIASRDSCTRWRHWPCPRLWVVCACSEFRRLRTELATRRAAKHSTCPHPRIPENDKCDVIAQNSHLTIWVRYNLQICRGSRSRLLAPGDSGGSSFSCCFSWRHCDSFPIRCRRERSRFVSCRHRESRDARAALDAPIIRTTSGVVKTKQNRWTLDRFSSCLTSFPILVSVFIMKPESIGTTKQQAFKHSSETVHESGSSIYFCRSLC